VFFICQRVRARCCWVRCATVHANDGARRSAGPGGPRGDGAVVLAGGYVRVREPRRRAGDARVDGCSWGASFFRLLLATARWKAGLHSLRGRAGHHPPPRGIGWSGVNVYPASGLVSTPARRDWNRAWPSSSRKKNCDYKTPSKRDLLF
jgi:hypothetical protein